MFSCFRDIFCVSGICSVFQWSVLCFCDLLHVSVMFSVFQRCVLMSLMCSVFQWYVPFFCDVYLYLLRVLCASLVCFGYQFSLFWYPFCVWVKLFLFQWFGACHFSDVFYFIEMVHMSVKCSIVQQYFMLVSKVLCVSSACFIVQWFFFFPVSVKCVVSVNCFSDVLFATAVCSFFQWTVCSDEMQHVSVVCSISVTCSLLQWNALCFSDVFKSSKLLTSFNDILINIFQPLFEVTRDPKSHPELHAFLQHVSKGHN